MSKPSNQLAKYRSVSYYHVLALCDSSQTATALAAETSSDVWQHPMSPDATVEDTTFMGRYSVKSLPSDTGRYCILINGATDANFTITKASWTSFTAASATMNDRNTSLALEGQISISEPKGVVFLDQVVNCCLQLGVDSANTFWVLKTFFVGYTAVPGQDDGIEYITDIPPIIFITYDVAGNFSVSGGEYELSFVAAANGASRLPQFSKSVTSINLKSADSFAGTLTSLETNVTENYNRYYDCVYSQIEAIPGAEDLKNSLRRVNYKITCGFPYVNEDGTPNTDYIVSDQSIQLKDHPECSSPSNIHISSGISIEDAIHRIISMCPRIKGEASDGVDGIKYTTKIHTWVESKPILPGSTVLEFSVGYRVERQMQPRSVTFDAFNGSSELTEELAKNVIEFDYLYTGKNIDILDFDIKMNMGMVYLQGMTIANPYKHPGQAVPIKGTTLSEQDLSRYNGRNIPVFFGTQPKTSSIKDTQNVRQTAQHAYSLTKHASLEMLEATIKITGNSQLLGSINNTSSPEKVRDGQTRVDKEDGFARFSNWSLSPSFAKINIKMPRNNNDISLFTGQQTSSDSSASNDYAVDFWFTGYYYVYGIQHVFDNGEFYQVLEALGIPEKNSFKTEQDTTQQRDINLNKSVGSCYENVVGCNNGSAQEGGSTVVTAPEQNANLEKDVAKQDHIESVPASDKNLSNIKGYDEADQDVKDAIHNAAVNNGVDEFTLAQMCRIESNFDKKAQNPVSSAGGLFQFIDRTWNGYGGGNKKDPELNADRGAKYMKENQRYLKSKLGRDPTAGELYLAHNQGTGGSATILRQINNGDGNKPARIDNLDEKVRANRIPGNSANSINQWAKAKMGSTLKSGIPHDKYDKVQPSTGTVSETVGSNKGRRAKDVVASTISCTEQQKLQNDETKKNNCIDVPTPEKSDEKTNQSTTNTSSLSSPFVSINVKQSPVTSPKKKIDPLNPLVSSLGDQV